METSTHGRCLCGQVQFSVQLPARWVAHCHCSLCRRGHGAGVVTWFGVALAQFQLQQGEIVWFRSSEQAERGRCRHCGSPLFFRSARWPDELHIVLAALNEPIAQSPQAHVYYADHVSWLSLADDLPRFRTVPREDDTPPPT